MAFVVSEAIQYLDNYKDADAPIFQVTNTITKPFLLIVNLIIKVSTKLLGMNLLEIFLR